MRIKDIGSRSWKQVGGGFMNCGFIVGYARYSKAEPNMIYIQQTRNDAMMIPVLLKKRSMADKFEEGCPVKAFCRVLGEYNVLKDRQDAKLVALHLDMPGINEMPAEEIWYNENNLPAGMNASEFTPSIFGDNRKLKIDGKSISNNIELAGVVCGWHMDPARSLENGKAIPKMLYVFLQQDGNILNSVPIRYKGRAAEMVKEHLRVGHVIRVTGMARVKMIANSGVPNSEGMVNAIPYLIIDGSISGNQTAKLARPGDDVPKIDLMPDWALDLTRESKHKMIEARMKAAEAVLLRKKEEEEGGNKEKKIEELIARAEF